MNLDKIAQQLNCQPCLPQTIKNICIDSRRVSCGDLFIALCGERYDGHQFIEAAVAQGAVAVICQRFNEHISVPQLVVSNTLTALATIAKAHRKTIACPIIAVTGSNGKTSVKEMIATILPKPSHSTAGNLNNHIGVPLTMLQLTREHRYAVIELGASHIGEIAYTVAIVQPHVTLINNIAPAHIAGFGSIKKVAEAKGEIHSGLVDGGTAIINEDDEYAHTWDHLLEGRRIIRFSLTKPVEVFASEVIINEKGCASFTLNLPTGHATVALQIPGDHSVRNALAAAACCYAINISFFDILNGLNRFQGVAGRMTYLKGRHRSIIIDDTYNANLQSVLIAIEVLARRPGLRILALGDLGELGSSTQLHHEKIGRMAALKGIDFVLTCGENSKASSDAFGVNAKHYDTQDKLAQDLLLKLNCETTVLVKGSRSAAMEKIVHQLIE
jgi:UDP-N-acetylmuramoyl-tripeptide--D-alanyl-D-alanine ligase